MYMHPWVSAGVVIAAVLICSPAASGSTVDTFTFTQIGWFDVTSPIPTTGNPEPNVILSGSFTGTVEPDGVIGLADLTAFTETINTGTGNLSQTLSQLSLFSFNVDGGASSLDIAGRPIFEVDLCQGAAVFLSPNCTDNFALSFRPGTFAAYEALGMPSLVSEDLPQITLVSSVIIPPGGTAPEPATFFLSGIVLLLLGRHVGRAARPAAVLQTGHKSDESPMRNP